jgi:drug/metabolite transporter (DMT)-like permease
MDWIFLSLLAPLFWTCSVFIDKFILHKYDHGYYDFIFFCTTTAYLVVPAILLYFGLPELSAMSLIPIGCGMLLIYSYLLYAKALDTRDASLIIILFKLTPLFTAAFGFIFLHQKLNALELTAFLIIFCGALGVSLKPPRLELKKGIIPIVMAIMAWSLITVITDYTLDFLPLWEFVLFTNIGVIFAGWLLLILPKTRSEVIAGIKQATTKKIGWYTGNNLLDLTANVLFDAALLLGPSAGLVSVVAQVQSGYGILLGILLTLLFPAVFDEDIRRKTLIKKVLGMMVMFFGVALLWYAA